MLKPYQLRNGSGHALLASYLLQPAATPVTWHGKYGRVGQITPTGGNTKDITPPYIAHGQYGQLITLSCTEKVRGASPFTPTQIPQPWECFFY